MTQDEFDYMMTFKDTFECARNGSYRAFQMSDAIRLNEIYTDLFGVSENVTCGRCLLNMLRCLGEVFDAHRKKENGQKTQITEVPASSPKKKGAKKNKLH